LKEHLLGPSGPVRQLFHRFQNVRIGTGPIQQNFLKTTDSNSPHKSTNPSLSHLQKCLCQPGFSSINEHHSLGKLVLCQRSPNGHSSPSAFPLPVPLHPPQFESSRQASPHLVLPSSPRRVQLLSPQHGMDQLRLRQCLAPKVGQSGQKGAGKDGGRAEARTMGQIGPVKGRWNGMNERMGRGNAGLMLTRFGQKVPSRGRQIGRMGASQSRPTPRPQFRQ
jgi:hypothetical protein